MVKMKKIGLVLLGSLVIGAISIFSVSCHSDVEENSVTENELMGSSFIASLDGGMESFMDAKVVMNDSDIIDTGVHTRAQYAISTPRTLYVDLSFVEKPVALEKIKTPGQILHLVKTTGAEISLINDGTYTHHLTLCEEESLEALDPLIQDSKNYLYGKGFSELEIQAMLKENGVDESALIPFVLSLAEEEESQEMSSNNLCLDTRSADWKKAGGCALKALGFDVMAGLAQSTAKTWSKAVLKTVFKTVASKVVGPVGVAIAVIEFSMCYWG